jgi:hypothetical protein
MATDCLATTCRAFRSLSNDSASVDGAAERAPFSDGAPASILGFPIAALDRGHGSKSYPFHIRAVRLSGSLFACYDDAIVCRPFCEMPGRASVRPRGEVKRP